MKINSKFFTAPLVTVAMVVSTIAPVSAATNPTGTIDYVAIGDSIAAGVRAVSESDDPYALPGWELESDEGYTDEIARWLGDDLRSFDEKYSISGNTADALAEATSKGYLASKLKKAELVTVTAGANDILGPLYDFFDRYVAGEITGDPIVEAGNALDACATYLTSGGGVALGEDMVAILSNILDANPDANVYVMGYFNPLPILAAEPLEADLTPFVAMINGIILDAVIYTMATHAGASIDYVDTISVINGPVDSDSLLLYPMYAYFPDADGNPTTVEDPYLYADLSIPMADIHLTEAGYDAVAQAFISYIDADF